MFIPVGFAHGFITLSEEFEIFYKTAEEFAPQADKGIILNDHNIRLENRLWTNTFR